MSSKPFLAITAGDPAGIGPRVAVLAAMDRSLRKRCRPVLVGDFRSFRPHIPARAPVRAFPELQGYRPDRLNVVDTPNLFFPQLKLGVPSRVAGIMAVRAIRKAVDLAMGKEVAAVVTGPVSKESLKLAEVPYPGHTELLQAMTDAPRVEMLMTAGDLRGLLITRHVPLKDVSKKLAADDIFLAVRLTDAFLRRLTGRRVRWAMCGLNPHAGDNGLLGQEEKTLVAPALRRLRSVGVRVEGPLPADVAWSRHALGEFDACACLYHDQGMIPLKTLHPKKIVNVTVGLPFIRTSPGHGTAFDLARGRPPFIQADPTPTIEAAHRALDAI